MNVSLIVGLTVFWALYGLVMGILHLINAQMDVEQERAALAEEARERLLRRGRTPDSPAAPEPPSSSI